MTNKRMHLPNPCNEKNVVRLLAQESEHAFTLIFDRYRARSDKRTFAIFTPDEEIAVNTITNDFVEKKAEENFRQVLTLVTGAVQATLPYGNVKIDGKGCGKVDETNNPK